MVAIPQYKKQVNFSNEHYGYYRANAYPDAFGASTARALQNLGNSVSFFAKSMSDMSEDIDQARQLEFSNYIDELERTELNDIENGYYAKLGKDAMTDPDNPESGAHGVMNSIEQKINQKQQELGLTHGRSAVRAYDTKTKKMKMLYSGAANHELEQTRAWHASTLQEAENAALTKGILHRDSEEDMTTALGNGLATIMNKAVLMHLDQDSTRIQMAKFKSKFYSGVLDAYLQDGSLKASDFYEKHKEELLPDAQEKYLGRVKNNELNYIARSVSERLFGLYPEDEAGAYAQVDKMENENERQAVEQRLSSLYSRKRRLDEQKQAGYKKNFYDTAYQRYQQGELITEDDIPQGVDGRTYFELKSSIDSLNKMGDVQTDRDTETYLWYTAGTDAERFKTMNLATYRMSLSKDDYSALEKRQKDILKGDYFTIIGNTDATREYIRQVTGINNKDELLYNEYQGMVRALEQRMGRKATDIEKENILKYLGTDTKDGKKAYQMIERGVKEQAEFFYKKLANNMAYYSAHHNNEMPPPTEVNRWLKDCTVQYYNKKYAEAQKQVSNVITTPKTGETKTLTYMADNFTSQIEKDLGVKINITSRYREPNGKYHSYHSDGRAMDVSMSEHTPKDRIRIVEKYINDPRTEAIGTSDPALIKKFKDKYKSKLVDERAFDKKHGTNHINHIHITTIEDNTAKRNTDVITIKNRLKNNGFSDTQIADYLKAKGLQ